MDEQVNKPSARAAFGRIRETLAFKATEKHIALQIAREDLEAVIFAAQELYSPGASAAIYIAGPMRGMADHNFPAFNAAAARFRARGFVVYNPVEIGEHLAANDPSVPSTDYLRADIAIIVRECREIALLPGWERSVGARAEVAIGISCGLAFRDALTMGPIITPRVTIDGGYERPPGVVDTLDSITAEILAWQCATFTQRSPHSITKHLLKEAKELHAAPHDSEEWADVLMLALALAMPYDDSDYRDPVPVLRAKLDKNKLRTWGQPDRDGVVEHIAEGGA